MFVQVGYGLEGVLPDALCKQITEYEIKPRFKAGDYAGGLTAGVNAIMAATRHEYKGTGTTVYSQNQNVTGLPLEDIKVIGFFVLFIAFVVVASSFSRSSKGHGWIITSGGLGGYSGGGGGWGGFSGGGGGGGFSGGGGSFGGGGAGS